MGQKLSFKGSGEGYVSHIHRKIRWIHVVISRGWKLTTTISNKHSLKKIEYGGFGVIGYL